MLDYELYYDLTHDCIKITIKVGMRNNQCGNTSSQQLVFEYWK